MSTRTKNISVYDGYVRNDALQGASKQCKYWRGGDDMKVNDNKRLFKLIKNCA